jgi:release factor glutamine methyltransferase
MRARALLDDAVRALKASPRLDHWQRGRERIEAEDLLMHVLRVDEVPDSREEIPTRAERRFRELIQRRLTGEPVPFIKGYTDFRGIDLLAAPGVFVPRDSSEYLAEQAVRRLRGRRNPVHLDLATGGGTIACSVAHDVPRARVYGADISKDAVALARRNARRLGITARFFTGDLFGAFPGRLRGRVDVITFHPPYVARSEMRELPEEIRDWEPAHTLTDRSPDGLGLLTRAVGEGPEWLVPNGWLLVEVSPDRAASVKRVFREGGFRDVESTKGGALPITRVIVGRRPA